MDKKSKLVISFFVIMIVLTVFVSYYRFFVIKDYEIIPLETTPVKIEGDF